MRGTRNGLRFAGFAAVVGWALGAALSSGCGSSETSAGSFQGFTEAGAPPGSSVDASYDAGLVDALSLDADATTATADGGPRPALHILFIGNSYTYVNDVPGILTRIAATAGTGPTIVTDEVVQGGAALVDHWDNGIAQKRIAERTWTHVVLQGQSFEPTTPTYFLPYAQKFGDLITDAGARPTWYVTWARAAGDTTYPWAFSCPDEMQDRLTFAYDEAKDLVPGSLLSCVGEAFRASLRDHPEIVLHQSDMSHATIAGSYLAAATFYVALTGGPVPESSEVPAGIDAAQAAALRQEANVGTACTDAHIKASLALSGVGGSDGPDGGPPFDFGTAGISLPLTFIVTNRGAIATDISDGHTLSAPFEWTGGAFPGGSSAPDSGAPPFCSGSLAPNATCQVSVTFTAESSGTRRMTILAPDAYQMGVSRALSGTSGSRDRALLTVSEYPDRLFFCTTCGPFLFPSIAPAGPYNFVVTNRGGAPTTSIGVGQPLVSPFIWGSPDAGAGFPGGTGTGTPYDPPPVTLPYCKQVLAPGEQCLVGVGVIPRVPVRSPAFDAGPPTAGVVSIAYADAKGPVTPYAERAIEVALAPSPDLDAGGGGGGNNDQ